MESHGRAAALRRGRRGGQAARGWTRRRFLATAASGAAWVGCGGVARLGQGRPGEVFAHGVASGDPLHDRVVLWTRVTPAGGRRAEPLDVSWRVCHDPELRDVAAAGSVRAGPARDFTVHVDALGLEPGRVYFYAFECGGERSPLGRTRTLPAGRTERVRLAFCSCANLPQGYFTAYRHIAARGDLDAVVHLGDYLYEYANGRYGDGTALGRVPEPDAELVTLADYRTRHAQYKRDPDLQELHRRHPMIAVWDDHELANDAWLEGAENHDPATQGPWAARRAAAVRAYYEWMPVRALPEDASFAARGRLHRSFRFGDLAELVMLDARLYGRSQQAARGDPVALADPRRELLGLRQREFLLESLARAQAEGVQWKVVGQQVFFAPLALPGQQPYPDGWDGYPLRRAQVLDGIRDLGIENVVILTGDIHSSWAADVPPDPWSPDAYDPATGRGSLAVELVAPAIASSPLASFPDAARAYRDVVETHPHIHLAELEHRGYGLLDLTRSGARAEWWWTASVDTPGAPESLGAAFHLPPGTPHLN